MKKVITYGTFDLFHQGHYNILKRAKEYGDYLIVGVTSESYDIERGKLSVRDSLTKRIENVLKTGLVDEVIIEEYLGQKIRDITKYNVDTLVIGDDWRGKFDHLKKYCNVVYLERTKNISSTMIREQSSNIFRIGIVAPANVDYEFLNEVKYVSGLHMQNVLVEDEEFGKEFCEKYSVNSYYLDFEEFIKEIDIVIVASEIEKRYELVKKCLQCGKHVISKTPISFDETEQQELINLSKEKHLVLIEDITTVYLRAFTQLLWMAKGDILGELLSVKCTISDDSLRGNNTIVDMMTLSFAMIIKLLGTKFDTIIPRVSKCSNSTQYINVTFLADKAVGNVEIGKGIELENEMIIVGDKSTIIVKNDWWNTGYFEVKKYGEKFVKKYSYNFEGNGFRYILQELSIMLRDNRYECTRLFEDESLCLTKMLNQMREK